MQTQEQELPWRVMQRPVYVRLQGQRPHQWSFGCDRHDPVGTASREPRSGQATIKPSAPRDQRQRPPNDSRGFTLEIIAERQTMQEREAQQQKGDYVVQMAPSF